MGYYSVVLGLLVNGALHDPLAGTIHPVWLPEFPRYLVSVGNFPRVKGLHEAFYQTALLGTGSYH